MPTFQNPLFHLHRQVGARPWRWNRQCSETSAYKIQMLGNYPEESIQQSEGSLPCLQKPATCLSSQPDQSSALQSLISNLGHVLNVVFFLLGDTPVSEFYMPTFRNTLSVPSSQLVSSCLQHLCRRNLQSVLKCQHIKFRCPKERIQHHLPPCCIQIHFNVIHLHLGLPGGLFPYQSPLCTFPVPHMCHMPHPFLSLRLDYLNNVLWGIQMKLLKMQ
jgi:hypothetical protein